MAIKNIFKGKDAGNESSDKSDGRSFQFSYNSNTSSLFSTKRTLSTGASSQPTSTSYSKSTAGEASFTSVGRSLMILREDDEDSDEYTHSVNAGSVGGNLSYNLKKSFSRRRSNISDDVSIANTENSIPSGNYDRESGHVSLSNSLGTVQATQSTDLSLNYFNEFVKRQLRQLSNSISNILIQVAQSVLSLTKASIGISDCIILAIQNISQHKYISYCQPNAFTTSNTIGLRRLVKNILHLLDNVLLGDVYDKSKAFIIKHLYDLFVLLKVINKPPTGELTNFINYLTPKLFAFGSTAYTSGEDSPTVEMVEKIMNSLLSKDKQQLFSDQKGSFVAPVLRGFQHSNLAVVTFVFGFPEVNREHHDVIKFFSRQAEDMHFLVQKNNILPASAGRSNSNLNGTTNANTSPQAQRLKTPFRTLEKDQPYIPISMSLSADTSLVTSGTLGGYIYPKVLENSSAKLEKYRGQVFGLTCSHVVLAEASDNEHPNVSIPSPVLINMYKNALSHELSKHKNICTPEYKAYVQTIEAINDRYPPHEITIKGKKTQRNLPEKFGTIVWGERTVTDNRLSDIAIVKIESDKKLVNYVGDDIPLSQWDPSLILSNLNVRSVVSMSNKKSATAKFCIPHANLPVFKIGSTTSYTSGTLNGSKMIYWSDGTLRSSEFVIGGDSQKGFASGGDSGSWVLSKMSDVNPHNHLDSANTDGNVLSSFIESFIGFGGRNNGGDSADETGLGVLGMLHSYDGEFKQFGLFTCMHDILTRLKGVTGLEWGVIGCDEESNDSIW